jgi:hypothetical protein
MEFRAPSHSEIPVSPRVFSMGHVSRRTVFRCSRARHAIRSHLPSTEDSFPNTRGSASLELAVGPGDDMAIARGARAGKLAGSEIAGWRAG